MVRSGKSIVSAKCMYWLEKGDISQLYTAKNCDFSRVLRLVNQNLARVILSCIAAWISMACSGESKTSWNI